MKRILIIAMAICCLAVKANAQLLYKISGDSLKPSYIIASHPYINPLGVVANVSAVKDALTNTEQLVEDMDRTPYASAISDAERLPEGKTLSSLLTPAQVKLLDSFLKKYTEVSWNSPYNQRRYNGKMPLAVLSDFYKLLFVANHMGEYDPTHSFNEYFEAQARRNGEHVYGLTEADEYVNTLKAISPEKQAAELAAFLENTNAALFKVDKSVAAFDNKDMEASAANALTIGTKPDIKAWTAKMVTFMTGKPTFFVLPASALGGNDGILATLKAQGYTVESVY